MRIRSLAPKFGWLVAVTLLAGCGTPFGPDPAAEAPLALPIGKVQGNGPTSPLIGQTVHIQGVVTGNFVSSLHGFFMQDANGEDDGDPTTSDGIFVAWSSTQSPKVLRGNRVRVEGIVAEVGHGDDQQTTLEATAVEVLGRGVTLVTELDAPLQAAAEWERYEGMWLRLGEPMIVTGNDGLLRFGELAVSFDDRQFSTTELRRPGRSADALHADNRRSRLILDDNSTEEYPDTSRYLPEPLSRQAPLRVGSVVHGVEGILHHSFGWRLQLIEKIERIEQAPRPAPPELPDGVRVASFNLFNWFNGDGQGGGFPTPRGATTQDEMNRQRDKLVAAIIGLKPDVAALMEVENDGYGRTSSLAELVAALNSEWPEAGYRMVDAGMGPGKDVMRVAMIYRQARVEPVGAPLTLEEGPFATLNRVPLLQAFRTTGGHVVFQVVANHLKSKRCTDAEGANADQGDGQACWNAVRTEAVQALDAWLDTNPGEQSVLGTIILGDLNSYAKEDPLQALRAAGWRGALTVGGAKGTYSFNYRGLSGRLDHALLSAGLLPHLRAAIEWHINADESEAFDYRSEHREKGWYAADPYRSSDHDPLVLVLDFSKH